MDASLRKRMSHTEHKAAAFDQLPGWSLVAELAQPHVYTSSLCLSVFGIQANTKIDIKYAFPFSVVTSCLYFPCSLFDFSCHSLSDLSFVYASSPWCAKSDVTTSCFERVGSASRCGAWSCTSQSLRLGAHCTCMAQGEQVQR